MQKVTPLRIESYSIDMHFPAGEVERGLQLLLSSVGVIEAKPVAGAAP